jgi:hypothetical protein
MPTVFIANLAVVLTSRFAAGDIADETAAKMLQEIQLRRIKARLRWLLSRGELAPEELQAKAEALLEVELTPYSTADDDDPENDPVFVEAMTIARDLIILRMAQEGLPPPKGIDLHAKALLDGMPDILERARLRIEARYRAASTAIAEL